VGAAISPEGRRSSFWYARLASGTTSSRDPLGTTKGAMCVMPRRMRIIIGGLTVALALAAAVNTATARRLEVSEQHFLALSAEVTFEAAGIQIVCAVTAEGSFHSRTISKVSGQLVGVITEAAAQHPCRRNELWILNGIERVQGATAPNTLPWQMSFLSFRGTLPRIQEIEGALIGAAFRIEALGILCLYKSTSTKWGEAQIKIVEGRITEIRANEEKRGPLFESQSGAFCPSEYSQIGFGMVTTPGHREIFVRLVQ
jgi:hypothetical protein